MGDFGVRVSHRLQHGPLWALSPRALRLWLFLAMKAKHDPQHLPIYDGYRRVQRVTVGRGQWLTSIRNLMKEAGYRSPKAVVADMKELRTAKAISVEEITPRFRNGNRGVSESETPGDPRFRNGNTGNVLATLVTVEGLALSTTPASKSETKEVQAPSSPSSKREQREREHAERVLSAEGR